MSDDSGVVLVVDDNPTKRYVISSWLRRAGHTIIEAATGGEALQTLRVESCDLVVLDVRLPDMDGFTVCERIKSDPRTSAVPVVHISATAVDVTDRTRGLNQGADAYLAEPIDPDEMLATVHALLRYFRARQRAERLAARLATLAEMTIAVHRAGTFADLITNAAAGAAAVFDRPAAIAVVSPAGRPLLARCAGAGAEATVQPWHSTDGRLERADRLTRDTEDSVRWPELDRVPDGTPLWVNLARPRANRPPAYVIVPAAELTPDDAHVLTQLGQTVALAIDAMRSYDEERSIALTLQHSLLPRELPAQDGLDLAVRYVPASDRAEIGGDFYELLVINGTLIAAIGDVAGHSLHAATVMAELRHVLRAYVAEGHGPAEVIRRLNNLMLQLLPSETATLCVLTLDLADGTLTVANAGHLPPVLVRPDGTATLISEPVPLLGIDVPRDTQTRDVLAPGDTLLLVTDGLVERRGRNITDSIEELRVAAATVGDDLDEYCDRLLERFVTGPNDDDIAIVALRRSAA
ncbi:hypothetical protein Val02_02470 [Virgisporangium aliadipatigenens]|uniref:Fused response regulator/phosphatase n=1 Tax=Virgisporangium aliadipatigenens TaxID=741659 RepID=A0A8J4DN18_9ACTN|nr:SpoIIE family protein phosphatase [Virgisporangium aliadipatigenens]GIJ43361.1 hypothetical protein Val02_02470 [Virgisporangium aliadipatigenens]